MHDFHYVGQRLYCEGVSLESLVRKFGTPLYVYSQNTLCEHYQKLDRAMSPVDHLICFATKSNSNLSVLRVLAQLGQEMQAKGKRELFEELKPVLAGDRDDFSYRDAAKRLKQSEEALRQRAKRMRERLQELIRHEILKTCDPAQVEEEIRYLFSAFSD